MRQSAASWRLPEPTMLRSDLRNRSVVGGLVTVIAASAAALLFVAQIYLYLVGNVSHSLHLAASTALDLLPGQPNPYQSRLVKSSYGKLPIQIHVTFPYIPCDFLEVKLDNAPLQIHDFDPLQRPQRVEKRRPHPLDLRDIFGASTKDPYYRRGMEGCTIQCRLRIPRVAGHLTIGLTREAWAMATQKLMELSQLEWEVRAQHRDYNKFNTSHYIHSIQFGKPFSKAEAQPLEKRPIMIENNFGGIAVETLHVKLIPTIHQTWFTPSASSSISMANTNTYQLSVVDHVVQPETLVSSGVPVLPGLSVNYDFTPLAVHHLEGRDPILIFLSSLVSIVGGAFVTVSLFTGCLFQSAANLAKKHD